MRIDSLVHPAYWVIFLRLLIRSSSHARRKIGPSLKAQAKTGRANRRAKDRTSRSLLSEDLLPFQDALRSIGSHKCRPRPRRFDGHPRDKPNHWRDDSPHKQDPVLHNSNPPTKKNRHGLQTAHACHAGIPRGSSNCRIRTGRRPRPSAAFPEMASITRPST